MRGWAIECGKGWIPSESFENPVIGLIVDESYPDHQEVVTAIRDCPWPEVVWVARDTDKRAMRAFAEAQVEPVKAPLNPWFKVAKDEPFIGPMELASNGKPKPRPKSVVFFDGRKRVRECDMMYGCTHILVFKNKGTDTSDHWIGRMSARAKITVFEKGKKAAVKRKQGRKVDA